MPKRTREHIIEDRSVLAFKSSLPIGWTYNTIDRDYGIDGQVEIFDKDGITTGKIFFVQLKATDEPDLKKALKIRFPMEWVEYYHSLPAPILIVRYHLPSGTLFLKWFHDYSPEIRSALRQNKRSETSEGVEKPLKSIAFNFQPSDIASADAFAQFERDIDSLRHFGSANTPTPLRVHIDFLDQTINGRSSVLLSSELRKVFERLSSVLDVSLSYKGTPHVRIQVAQRYSRIKLVSGQTATYHTDQSFPETPEVFSSDLLVCLAQLLSVTGHKLVAAQIFMGAISKSSLTNSIEVLVGFIHCLMVAKRNAENLRLVQTLACSDEGMIAAEILTVPLLYQWSDLSEHEIDALIAHLKNLIGKEVERGILPRAANSSYNLGRLYGYMKRYRLAVYYLNHARKLDAAYEKRKYFFRELAGFLFALEKFKASARFYRKALELGAEGDTSALLADALMYTGDYAGAFELLERYAFSDEKVHARWRLRAWFLATLINTFGVPKQNRQVKVAETLATVPDGTDNDAAMRQFTMALGSDLLCGLAWFNQGCLLNKMEDYQGAFISFLACAVLQEKDVEAWSNAIVLGVFRKQELHLLHDVLFAAVLANKHDLLPQLYEQIRGQVSEDGARFMIETLDKYMDGIVGVREDHKLRFTGDDEYHQFVFSVVNN